MEGIATSLDNLGNIALEQSDFALARSQKEESLAIRRKIGDRHGITMSLSNLGLVALSQGNLTLARALQEESLALRKELGDRPGIAACLYSLGAVALAEGDCASARPLLQEGLRLCRDLEIRSDIMESLDAFASLDAAEQRPALAVQLFGAADRFREEMGYPRSSSEKTKFETALDAIRRTLDAEAYSAAWSRGKAMSLAEAIALALQ